MKKPLVVGYWFLVAVLPLYQSAWEDGQRAVRLVRSEARKRGFQRTAAPGTGSYTRMGRMWEFMNRKGFNK